MAYDFNKELDIDGARNVIQRIKDAGLFKTPTTTEQTQSNFNTYQGTTQGTATNPTNVSSGSRIEGLPPTSTSSIYNTSSYNVNAGTFDFDNYASHLGSGNATQEDITKGSSGMVQSLLADIRGKGSKSERELELRDKYDTDALTMEAEEYQGQLDAEKRALDTSIRGLYSAGGLTKVQLGAQAKELTRMSLQKQADIAIIGNMALNRLDKVEGLITNRLDLEFGEQEERIADKIMMINAVSGLESDVKSQLLADANDEKDALKQMEANKSELYQMAQQAYAAQNPELGKYFISLTQGDVSPEMLDEARRQGITSGIYSPATGGVDTGEQELLQSFYNDASKEIMNLAKTDDWGTSFDSLKTKFGWQLSQYGMTDSEINLFIDNALNKASRNPEEIKSSGGFGSYVSGTLNKLFPGKTDKAEVERTGPLPQFNGSYEGILPEFDEDFDPLKSETLKNLFRVVSDK